MTLSSTIKLSVDASEEVPLALGTSAARLSKSYSLALLTGTLAGQADRVFHGTRTLAASATEDLDLAGVLTGALGTGVSFARVKALIIGASAANANDVIVGGATTNGFVTPFGAATHTVRVRPGGFFALSVGATDLTAYAVTANTGDLLRVGNGGAGTAVTYDVIIIGASS